MPLDPLAIKSHDFARTLRGYDPDEVRSFLQTVSQQWEEQLKDLRRMEQRVEELEGKLEHYVRIEEALQEAVHSARENARRAQETAEQRAKLIIEEAEMRAQQVVQDAEQERYLAKQDLSKLNNRQSEIAARLRAFLMSELEILSAFTGDQAAGFLPRASERRALPAAAPAQEAPAATPATTPAARAEPPAPEPAPAARAEPPAEPESAPRHTAVDFRSLFASPESPSSTSTPPAPPRSTVSNIQRDSELEKAKIRRIIEDLD